MSPFLCRDQLWHRLVIICIVACRNTGGRFL